MPVYKIGSGLKEAMAKQAIIYMDRMKTLALNQCPITRDMIQSWKAEPDVVAYAQRAADMGLRIATADETPILFKKEDFPGIDHYLCVNFRYIKPQIYVTGKNGYWPYTTGLAHPAMGPGILMAETKNMWPLRSGVAALSDAQRAAIGQWASTVVKACRQKQLVVTTVNDVLTYCDTTAAVLNIWPGLVSLVEDATWKTKFRNPPVKRIMKNYEPSAEIQIKFEQRIRGCDILLSQAMMLPAIDKSTKNGFNPIVEFWENRESDPEYTK